MQRLNDKNMPTQDLSGIEAAQVSHDGDSMQSMHSMYMWASQQL